ncbi:ABC transporter substrate-binding protein [Streptomyces sp. NPDC001037]|uniref:ABC transporter substrate-binding protein n=1 Tax=Streptomyces sp. NPDC001037 TaxID=3364542 RepID=UPI00369CE266
MNPHSATPHTRTAAAILALTALLTACSGTEGDTASTAGAAPGGTLSWSLPTPSTWDPVTSQSGIDVTPLSLVYDSITRLGPKGEARPGIARTWAYSKDGRTLTFTLRPGLTFSDGTPLNAEAVKKSIERGKTQADSGITGQLDSIATIDAPNPTTVVLHLKRKDYALPLVFGGKTGMVVSPKAAAADPRKLATAPVGSGPFTLTSYSPDGQAVLKRNPHYWDAKDIHLAGVTLKFLSDPQAIVSALRSGETQLASFINGTQVASLKASGLAVDEFPSLQVSSIEVNAKLKPFDNPLFTQAVNHAIDRKALVKVLNGGHGEPTVEPFPDSYLAYDPGSADAYAYDLPKAKSLLKQAKYDGKPFPITWFSSPGGIDRRVEAELLQDQLKKAGINTTLEQIPVAQVADKVYVKHQIAFFPSGVFGRESPAQQLSFADTPYGSYDVPALTKALQDAGDQPVDSPGYAPALRRVTAQTVRSGSNIMLFTSPWLFGRAKQVTGFAPAITSPRLEGVRLSS